MKKQIRIRRKKAGAVTFNYVKSVSKRGNKISVPLFPEPTPEVTSLVPRPLFSVFICGGEKKGLVALRRTFCSTDSQILGVVNRC